MSSTQSNDKNYTGFELRPQNKDLNKALHYIEGHLEEDINLEMLADISGYTYHHFCHLFKIGTGFTPKQYIITRRLNRAAKMLVDGLPLIDVAEKAGYGSSSSEFCRAFKKFFGLSTKQYIREHSEFSVEPDFINLEGRTVIGYRFEPDSDDVIGSRCYWQGKVFDPALSQAYNSLDALSSGECGFWALPSFAKTKKAFYLYGVPMKGRHSIPDGLTGLYLPGGRFALFPIDTGIAFADMCDNMRHMQKYVLKHWIPENNYIFNNNLPMVEYYHGTKAYLCVPIEEMTD